MLGRFLLVAMAAMVTAVDITVAVREKVVDYVKGKKDQGKDSSSNS